MPIQGAGGAKLPAAWSTLDQTIVDVSSIMGTDGKPVDVRLCGAAATRLRQRHAPGRLADRQDRARPRGTCTFASKADRAKRAGAIGLILADNRFGEANAIPIPLPMPAGMISDLDASLLRGYASQHGGQATIRVSSDIREIQTGPERRDHELLVRRARPTSAGTSSPTSRHPVSTSSRPRRR